MRTVDRVGVFVAFVLVAAPVAAQIPPSSTTIFLEEITTGLGGFPQFAPTELVALPDGSGRMAVSTLGGPIRLIDSEGGFLDSANAPYINVTSVTGGGAYGTTGFAIHPDFGNADAPGYGKLYSIVTAPGGGAVDFPSPQGNGNHIDTLVEWTADDPTSNSPSFTRRDVIRFGQPGENHNVTDIDFDTQGFLYISSGDGGNAPFNSQDLSDHHGTVFRVDPLAPAVTDLPNVVTSANGRYSIPESNPFLSDGDANTIAEAYAYGFRSPYRISVDAVTGDVILGDVGGGSREEVNVVQSGGNFGWPNKEGTIGSNDPSFIDPVFEYGRDEGETVVGGLVYRGQAFPEFEGQYLFADFGRQVTGGQAPTPARLFVGDLGDGSIEELLIDPLGEQLADVSPSGRLTSRQFVFGFGQDLDGEVYLVVGDDPQFPAATNPDGRIFRVLPQMSSGVLGDINQDGVVSGDGTGAPESDDVSAFIVGWKTTGHATRIEQLMNGDLNFDGITNLSDWHILRINHPINQNLSLAELLGASIPEPSTAAYVGAALIGMLLKRRAARD